MHVLSQTVPSRAPRAGTQRHVQPEQMETKPIPCQAQGARTSQEMGSCASLSVSQEQVGHRNEPHPLPRGPKAPGSITPSLVTWSRAEVGPCAVPGVLWSPRQPGEWNPMGALAEGPLSHPGTCTPAFGIPQLGYKARGRGGLLAPGEAAAQQPAASSGPLEKDF